MAETPFEKSSIWGAWPLVPTFHPEHLILDTGAPVLPGTSLHFRGFHVSHVPHLFLDDTSLHEGVRPDKAESKLAGGPSAHILPLITELIHSSPAFPSRLQRGLLGLIGCPAPRTQHAA